MALLRYPGRVSRPTPILLLLVSLPACTDGAAESWSVPVVTEGESTLVNLDAPVGLTLRDGAAWNEEIASTQDAVIRCAGLGPSQILLRAEATPILQVQVDAAGRAHLASCPGVVSVHDDSPAQPMLVQSVPLVGGRDPSFGGNYGNGQVVAVLDTGWESSQAQLSGRVVYQYDTANDDGSAAVNSAACAHGTNVAAIAAGSQGVANDADLAILQVFSENPNHAFNQFPECSEPCCYTFDSAVADALDRVAVQVQGGLNVASVNMSIGGGSFEQACSGGYDAALSTLHTAGVTLVAAAGNAAESNAISYPACYPDVIAVAAVWDEDRLSQTWDFSQCQDAAPEEDGVTCFSNGGPLVDLAAPGALIEAGGYAMTGTSQASPHVAGAVASLRGLVPTASNAEVLAALLGSPVSVFDTDAGLSYPRLSLPDALAALGVDSDGDGWDGALDCEDSDPNIYDGAPELCDGVDNDCDGLIDDGSSEDNDGDGYPNCGGDCNDGNSSIHPGATEICDAVDQDCDGDERNGFGADGDGVATCQNDCDDNDPTIGTGAPEQCDGIDNDCDVAIDEGVAHDIDGDGTTDCAGDCNDNDPAVEPGAVEVCDATDQDCDGEGWNGWDGDGDGFASCQNDCDEGDPAIHPGATEPCDGIDNDCDGIPDNTAGLDQDLDGFTGCEGDCDDLDPFAWPSAPEVCDIVDQDCDGLGIDTVDLDGDGAWACLEDCDDDDPTAFPGAVELCDGVDNDCDADIDGGSAVDLDADGVTDCAGDCDENDPGIHPGAPEVCDTIDQDCDGAISEDFDADGDGIANCEGDCDDEDPAIHPGAAEACNGVDDDCDGGTDNGAGGDFDGDGWNYCGQDCDDSDPTVFPTAPELCDEIDQDCDGVVWDDADEDGDDAYACHGDCDDSDPSTWSGATEICDGVDNNCDGVVDEGIAIDGDGDGMTGCAGDCDDDNDEVRPGLTETCDLLDQDCDGTIDEGWDGDGDGHSECGGDCNDGNDTIHPDAPEDCDGVDQDCADDIETERDADQDGFWSCEGDCDDEDGNAYPDAPEFCDGIDQDCDGAPEAEDQLEFVSWYADRDGDGHGDPGAPWANNPDCAPPPGHVQDNSDCDDRASLALPGGDEGTGAACMDRVDDDCDGEIDLQDDDCRALITADGLPTGCIGSCDQVAGSDGKGLLLVPLLFLVLRRRPGSLGLLVLLPSVVFAETEASQAPPPEGPKALVIAAQADVAREVMAKKVPVGTVLQISDPPANNVVFGVWMLGTEIGEPCRGPNESVGKIKELVEEGRQHLSNQGWFAARATLEDARAILSCVSGPVDSNVLWDLHRFEAVSIWKSRSPYQAETAVKRAIAIRKDLNLDPTWPPEFGNLWIQVQRSQASVGPALVRALVTGEGKVGEAWVDGSPVGPKGLAVEAGEHLIQVRGSDARLHGVTASVPSGGLLVIADPESVAKGLGGLDRLQRDQLGRWLALRAESSAVAGLWIVDRSGGVVQLIAATEAAVSAARENAVQTRGPDEVPRVALGIGGAWQLTGTDHYVSIPVDLGFRVVGPLRVEIMARPSFADAGASPIDGQRRMAVLVPFGGGAGLRIDKRVRPIFSLWFQGAFTQDGVEERRIYGLDAPEPTSRFVPGIAGRVGVELPLPNSPLAFRPTVEVGVLGTQFNLRAGLQLVAEGGVRP